MVSQISLSQKQALENYFHTVTQNFSFFEIVNFYLALVKNSTVDLTTLLPSNIQSVLIGDPTSKYAKLSLDRIRSTLDRMRNGEPELDAMFFWTINNSVRAISMAWVESIDETDFSAIALTDIFDEDTKRMAHFGCIMKFIRNCFSHNIQNDLSLNGEDFDKQKRYWLKKFGTIAKFSYDYRNSRNMIHNSEYQEYSIQLDWDQVVTGKKLGELFSIHDLYMTVEFCFNVADHLYQKYLAADSLV